MPIQPIRVASQTPWGIDLPPVAGQQPRLPLHPTEPGARYRRRPNPDGSVDRLPTWEPAPPLPMPAPGVYSPKSNETGLNGRNLRYAIHGDHYVSIPYLSANLVDRTPQDPLDIWKVGSYNFNVRSALIYIDEVQLNGALAGMLAEDPKGKLKKAEVSFMDGNRARIGAVAKFGFLPVPLSLRARIEPSSSQTLRISPESVKVFGLPIWWAVRLFRVDVAKMLKFPALAPGPKGSLEVDLRKVDFFEGQLTGFGIRKGQAGIKIGGQPDPDLPARQRGGNPNYAEVIAYGETSLDSGVLRNAKVVIMDNTPEDPYSMNRWDSEGFARLEYGKVVLPEAKLVSRFGNVGGGFYMNSVRLEGTDLVIKGEKEVLGMPIPVRFKIRFGCTPAGELLLTPHDVHVAGLGFGKGQIIDAMKGMKGMRQVGEALVLDLKVASALEMPPIRSVTAERGKIVLNT